MDNTRHATEDGSRKTRTRLPGIRMHPTATTPPRTPSGTAGAPHERGGATETGREAASDTKGDRTDLGEETPTWDTGTEHCEPVAATEDIEFDRTEPEELPAFLKPMEGHVSTTSQAETWEPGAGPLCPGASRREPTT